MRWAVLLGLAASLQAQTPERVKAGCTPEDVQQLQLDCSVRRPCPIYLEIAGLEPIGNKLFVTGNLHTSTATLSSILLASRDGGLTWSEPHPRIRGAVLEQIQFIDHGNGWIGGQNVQYAPTDPFLLITHDGGDTWNVRPVVDAQNRNGAIERFWFTSPSTGTLLIDRIHSGESGGRHELYESMTGGESWTMLRSSADPITVNSPAQAARHPDWRVRADAATKSYRIESRESGAWKTIASFLIQPGECAPADMPVVEAEPPQTTTEQVDEQPAASPPREPKTPPTLRKKRPRSN
jgi:hypothetical protein